MERVNHNGKIFVGGVYNRGSNYYQLEGFNYTTIIGKGTQQVGWYFNVAAGDFNSVSGSISITFIINNLYLIRKIDNN